MLNVKVLFVSLGLTVLTAGCQKTNPPEHHHDHGTGDEASAAGDHQKVPPAVSAALEQRSPGAKITKVHSHARPDGTERWHLNYITPDGKEDEASFEANGKFVE